MKRLMTIAIGALLSLGLLMSAAPAQSQTVPSYRIVALPSGFLVFDVNDSGQVAGCYPGASPSILHAVIYSNGNITDLGVGDGSCARVINNKGDVAGINSAGHIFLWKPALPGMSQPPPQDLGLPPSTYVPYGIQNIGGINEADQIAGSSWSILGNTEGFIWQPGTSPAPGAWTELPPDPVNGVLSIGLNAINDLGDVAGQTTLYSRYVGGYTIGYLRTSGGAASVISPYPYWQHCGYNGAQVPTVVAAGINDSGEVVGSHGGNLCNVPVAFIYTSSGGLALHDGSSQTLEDDALGVTNDGRVIVNFLDFSIPYSLPYGLLYMAPGFSGGYYLTQMVRPDCGWTQLYGSRISRNTGNIVGGGQTNQGARQAFLMTPLSSPPQTMADGCTVPPANPKPTAVPRVNQLIVEATGPNGASVTLDGSGSSAPNGGALTYSWTGPFGTASGLSPTVTLPVGTSTINLIVTDTLGDTGSASIQITVQDTTPPVLTLPANPSTQATSASGAAVTFTPTANDLVSGAVPVTCTPASGSTFAIGTTTVNCSATDAAGNTAAGSFTVTVTRLSQTISFPAIANHTYGDPDFPLSGTSSSSLPLTYTTASNPYCMLIGFTVHIITAGICPITAQQAGNGIYLPAADVTQSFTIAQATQTISFGPVPNHTYGDADFPLSATSSSGLPVTYTTASNPYCMLIGFTVHIITAGICPITAQQVGNGTYLPAADVTQSFTINRADAVIVVTPYSVTYDGSAHTATGTVTGVGAASLSGLSLTGTTHTNAGTYSDSWTFTDATGNYNSVSGTVQDAIARANAVVSVTPYSVTYDGNMHTATGTATGVGGASLSGLSLAGTMHSNAGTYSTDSWTFIDPTGNYNSASGSVSDAIAAAPSTTTVSCGASVTYNGAAQMPCSATATGAGGLSQTLTVSYVNNINAGTATASATFAGDANHTGSGSSANFTINKANQVITWNAPATMTYGAPLSGTQLDATVAGVSGGTAPGALTYSPASGTILSAGSNTLTVTAAATSNYNSATKSVSISVQYLSGGMCGGDVGHAILQPINADGSGVWKQGSTVPAKFRVCDVNGVSIGTAGVVKNFVLYQINSGTITAVDETAVNSTNDLAWHFDPTAQQWIFNLSTKTAPQNVANQTYYYRIDLNDGSSIYFNFGLR